MDVFYIRKVVRLLVVAGMIFTLPFQSVYASQPHQLSTEAIDTYITEQMKALDIPGVAVGIVRGDQVVYVP